MKICTNCGSRYDSPGWDCPACSFKPARFPTHVRLSPEVHESSVGFESDFYENLFNLEAHNFWFRARNKLIQWAVKTYFRSAESMLEIGCGTGFVLSGIEKAFPRLTLAGTEVLDRGLELASARLKTTALYQMDARSIPFEDEFDVIGAFDVLEHIDEDSLVLREIHRAVRPGGGIVITVPQHRWLWSHSDVYAHHQRRYTRADLTAKVVSAGFQISRVTSFVSLLLPLLLISRRLSTSSTSDPYAEYKIPAYQDLLFENAMRIERSLIEVGVSFPAGGSLLLVAHKSA